MLAPFLGRAPSSSFSHRRTRKGGGGLADPRARCKAEGTPTFRKRGGGGGRREGGRPSQGAYKGVAPTPTLAGWLAGVGEGRVSRNLVGTYFWLLRALHPAGSQTAAPIRIRVSPHAHFWLAFILFFALPGKIRLSAKQGGRGGWVGGKSPWSMAAGLRSSTALPPQSYHSTLSWIGISFPHPRTVVFLFGDSGTTDM